jgi:hypothetical protein
VRWRLGDSSGQVADRVSGAEHAYHYEGQAADQQHPPPHWSSLPIDIHDMTLCGEGPVVSRHDSVANLAVVRVEKALEQPTTWPVSVQPGAPVPVVEPIRLARSKSRSMRKQLGARSGTEGVQARP